jgi:hypothetical protein
MATQTETVRREWEEGHRRFEALARDVISERAAAPGWPRTVSIVEDEAFHQYQRGAVDYFP